MKRLTTTTQRLRARVAQLESEREAVLMQSRKVAEANARAALEMAAHNDELESQGQELAAALEAARAAVRKKDEFVAKVSHELRTPLAGIIGMMRCLLDAQPDAPDVQEYATTAFDSAEGLLQIINDLLDFSHLSAERATLGKETLDLWRLLEDVARMLAPQARARGLQLHLEISPRAPRDFVGDAGRLRQVLVNLGQNALKFTEEGHVRLSLEHVAASSDVFLSVEDTGCGISEAALPHLFDPFEQVDNSAARTHGGVGLGLAISRELIEAMGGSLLARSQVGEGSRFTAHLPGASCVAAADWPAARFKRAFACVQDSQLASTLQEHLRARGVTLETYTSLEELRAAATPAIAESLTSSLVLAEHSEAAIEILKPASKLELSHAALFLLAPIDLPVRSPLPVLRLPLRVTELHDILGTDRQPDTVTGTAGIEGARAEVAGSTVLVVEDNRVNQKVAQRFLERLGCKVHVAENGLEFLEAVAEVAPDCILMDCQMPLLDGYQATRRFRALAAPLSRTPVIAVTAHASKSDRQRCLDAGMDDYISKPFAPDALAAKLVQWMCSNSPAADV